MPISELRRLCRNSVRHLANAGLIAWVYLMASKVRVFALAPLPLVNEPLPLLSHFGPKRFEAGIGC